MTIYTVFSWIFLFLILGFTIFWACWFLVIRFKNNKTERANNIAKFRTEIRNYKFGKFLWVYVLSFPLFIMSFAFQGQDGWSCVFKALTNAFKLMALQFDFNLPLVDASAVYAATIHITYIVAVLNMAMFIMSCLNQLIWSFIAWARFNHFGSKKTIILGNNETSEILYRSVHEYSHQQKEKNHVSFVGHYNKEVKWNLFAKDVRYISRGTSQGAKKYLGEWLLKHFFKKCEKGKANTIRFFINFNDDKENIDYCSFLAEYIEKYIEQHQGSKNLDEILSHIEVYVYYSTKYMSSYDNYVEKLRGCLHLIRKENIIANDFINKYPVALYTTDKQVDVATSCLKDNVKININFLGFGSSSQQLFMSLFTNTQFAKRDKKDPGKILIEPANFYIYDSKITDDNKFFNSTIRRYFNLFDKYDISKPKDPLLNKDKNGNEYFELPTLNIVHKYFGEAGNIDKIDVKEKFYEHLLNENGNNLNYVIVSLTNDFESIDIANRLWKTIKSKPNKYKNTYIFIKVDNEDLVSSIIDGINDENIILLNKAYDKELHLTGAEDQEAIIANLDTFKNKKCVKNNKYEFLAKRVTYGSFKSTSYNYEKIINEKTQYIGILQGQLYKSLANKDNIVMSLEQDGPLFESNLAKWNNTEEYGRQSNINAALNLRSKLLLMGLDIEYDVEGKFKNYDAYWDHLAANDKPTLSTKVDIAGKVNGKDYLSIDYSSKVDVNNIDRSSRRWLLANLEHSRWNHYEICIGFVPMSIAGVEKYKEHKDIDKCYNACITSFDGLIKLKDKISSLGSDACDDIINYDYNQFDAAWHILHYLNCGIVDKANSNDPFLN